MPEKLKSSGAPSTCGEMQPAGIRQTHGPRGFVQRFAGGVVARLAENFKVAIILYQRQMRVAAADNQTQKRRLQIRVTQIVRRDMAAQMMHGHKRQICRIGEAFGVVDADEQRADQPGRIGHGNGVDAAQCQSGVGKRLTDHAGHRFRVAARGDFGHHAAIELMFLHLRGDHIRQRPAAVFHNGGGGFVAGGFNG